MDAELKTLLELQELDQTLTHLTLEIDSSPVEIQTLKDQLNEFIHETEERKARLAANQKERRELEGDVQEIHSKVARHKDQLYQVKTNDQYRAMLKEIETEEGNVRKIEDRLLEKMIESEQFDRLIREATSRLEKEKSRVEAEISRHESERRAAENERDTLSAQRLALVAGLSKGTYALYEKLLKARNGMALAEVRDGFCSGCHVRLRPQAYNNVRTTDLLLTCETCSRILYYVEPPAQEASELPASSSQRAAS